MVTITAEQAEAEAARNWCAGMLSVAGSMADGDVAKRYLDIGVGVLLSVYKDAPPTEDERERRCREAYDRAAAIDDVYPPVCIVDGKEHYWCHNCPLQRGF